MITVYYDGKCPICSKEIDHYRKLSVKTEIKWQDVNGSVDELANQGISLSSALKRLHVKSDTGKIYIGVDGFILVWQQLPRWHVLAKLISLPGIYSLAVIAYDKFAERRFKHLSHCQQSEKH